MKKNILVKKNVVSNLEKSINDNIIFAFIDFSNLKSLELKEIRQNLRNNSILAVVIKNTLVKKVLLNFKYDILKFKLIGQNLLVFANNISQLINILNKINKKNINFKINSVFLYNRVYNSSNYLELKNIGDEKAGLIKFIFFLKMPMLKFLKSLKYSYIKLILLLKIIEKNKRGI